MCRSRWSLTGWLATVALASLVAGTHAQAQTPYQLIPVLTEQTQIAGLSDKFGVPIAGVVNDAGAHAFVGVRGSALFYRRAGKPSPARIIQYGDAVPGIPGSRLSQIFTPLLMNGNGVVFVRAEVYTVTETTHVYLKYDGTTLQTVLKGTDAAPGGGTYGLSSELVDVDDSNDLLIYRSSGPQSLVLIAGGNATQIAAAGGAAPNTGGGTYASLTGVQLTNSSEILFNAAITGGTAASGLFAWKTGTVRKVVAHNDPNPAGGAFSNAFGGATANWSITSSGLVTFVADSGVFTNTQGGGTAIVAVPGTVASDGSVLTSSVNFSWNLFAMSESGDVVFGAAWTGGGGFGVFRWRSGMAVDTVAKAGDVAPGTGGKTFSTSFTASVNHVGSVTVSGYDSTAWLGLFQKISGGSLTAIALAGQAVLSGQLFAPPATQLSSTSLTQTQTLASGIVFLRAHIANAPSATHAQLFTQVGFALPLMSTGDALPPGARTIIRPNQLTAAGTYIGVTAFRAGGRESLGVIGPASQSLMIVATEGDVVPGSGGGTLIHGTVNTALVNSAGDVVFQASALGGSSLTQRNVILSGGIGSGLALVMIDGTLDNGGRTLTAPNLTAGTNTRPVPINASGRVAFTAQVNGGARGIFLGSTTAAPAKVAILGDTVSTGLTITSIVSTHGGVNNANQVLFTATTSAGAGLFVAAPGGVPAKIAQVGDAVPFGGTFTGFGSAPSPGFNNLGQVAFMASVAGGFGGGIFLGSPGNAPVAIVFNGDMAPGGGLFVMPTPRPDAVINDAGDIAFVSDLSGGPANSGVFIRRFGLGAQLLANQGQFAPGTVGTFDTFSRFNNLVGQPQQLSESGQVAFRATVSGTSGWWHHEPSGALQLIMRTNSSLPEFDGGTTRDSAGISSWMTGDRFAVWAPLVGGPHGGGLYLWTPIVAGAATGTGSNVVATPVDTVTGQTPVTLTFASVSVPGTTSLARAASGPPVPRGWYRLGGTLPYYGLTTTATFSGTVTVCINFAGLSVPAGAVLRLLHYENGNWVDVTTSGPTGTTICGAATALSAFVVAHALNKPTSNIIQNGTFSSGISNWALFEVPDIIHNNAANGVFEYYRANPTTTPSGSAVVLQNTGVGFAAGAAIVASFDIGNSDSVRKRITVLIHESNFSDLSVCTFWLPAFAPIQTYAMRTHTTVAWPGATISFYTASPGSNGGVYQLDNVVMGPGHALTTARTDCVDPFAPPAFSGPDSPTLLVNGDFGTNDLTSWTAFGTITAQVTAGVAQFIKPSATVPAGALIQPTGTAVSTGQLVTASFQLGNSSNSRKRITVLIHDQFFVDLAACTFWLPPGQALATYSVRSYVTFPWTSAMISFYPATIDQAQWFLLDDVSMQVTPGAPTYGTDCVEPGGGLSGLGLPPPPAPEAAPLAMSVGHEELNARARDIWARAIWAKEEKGVPRL